MLQPTTAPLRPATEPGRPSRGYYLSEVNLDIPSANTAIFTARLHGPAGSKVWLRAWLANEMDGTLAETASEAMNPGDLAILTVKLGDARVPENACIRIESAPFATEQVVIFTLPKPTIQAKTTNRHE